MTRGRLAALIATGALLATLLLDWTIGTVDVLAISRVADLATMRGALREGGGAAASGFAPGLDLRLGRGSWRMTTGGLGERTGPRAAAVAERGAALRILVLGDGAAFGAGVDDERCFARRLEGARARDGRHCAVINAAQPFFDLADSARAAAEWIPRVEPELVLLCLPAIDDAPPALLRAVAARSGPTPPWWAGVLPSLWRVLRCARGDPEASAPTAPSDVARAAAIRQADEIARQAGALLIVVDLGGFGTAVTAVERIDAAPSAREREAPRFVDAAAGWPSAVGHERFADRIGTALREAGVLDWPNAAESSR